MRILHQAIVGILIATTGAAGAWQEDSPPEGATGERINLFRDQVQVEPAVSDDDVKIIVKGEVVHDLEGLGWEPMTAGVIGDVAPDAPTAPGPDARVFFVSFKPDVLFSDADEAASYIDGTVSLNLGFDERELVGDAPARGTPLREDPRVVRPTGYVRGGFSADFRYRDGDFPGGEDSEITQEIRQLIYGVSGSWQPQFIMKTNAPFGDEGPETKSLRPLEIRLSHYWVSDHAEEPAPLPEGIEASRAQLQLKLEYYLPESALGIQAEGRLTYVTDGSEADNEEYADIALLYKIPETEKWEAALRYRTGANLGFEYDKQLLFGIAWRWFQGLNTGGD